MPSPPAKRKKRPENPSQPEGEPGQVIPKQTVEILNRRLGIDVSTDRPDQILAVMGSFTQSRSVSPYTSADMLREYKDAGFPELVDKVIEAIDRENAHRQELEASMARGENDRLNRAQYGALIVAILGIIGSLVASYLGAPPTVCVVVAAVSVGGPPAATIIARIIDVFYKNK